MDVMKSLRQTGRTTRMLEAAIAYANEKGSCLVVAADANHARTLERSAAKIPGYSRAVRVLPMRSLELDPLTLCVFGSRDGVFIDHFAIESRYSTVLRRLHEFD